MILRLLSVYRFHIASVLTGFSILLTVSACGVPEHMQVRAGLDPDNQDKDVRFRTTYYFRAFDYCFGEALVDNKKQVKILPETDSLYRFRMSGKAHSLTTKVNFESGSLLAAQIDPFGANVVFDENLGRFRFQSQQETQIEAARKAALSDYKELLAQYREVKDDTNLAETKKMLDKAMKLRLEDYVGASLGDKGAEEGGAIKFKSSSIKKDGNKTTFNLTASVESTTAAVTVTDGGEGEDPEVAIEGADSNQKSLSVQQTGREAEIRCAPGGAVRRGFQILGPEGWRTFNQDERLIMAMSSDASPLIGALKEFSSRVLNAKSDPAQTLLPLVQEDLRINRAERVLDRLEPSPPEVAQTFSQVMDEFAPEEQAVKKEQPQ